MSGIGILIYFVTLRPINYLFINLKSVHHASVTQQSF